MVEKPKCYCLQHSLSTSSGGGSCNGSQDARRDMLPHTLLKKIAERAKKVWLMTDLMFNGCIDFKRLYLSENVFLMTKQKSLDGSRSAEPVLPQPLHYYNIAL